MKLIDSVLARVGATLFITLVCASNALAGTVTTTADSGPGSLRAVLAAAPSGDTINFAVPLANTIALTTELPITQSVTIQGPGANLLTISNAAGRVFNLDASTGKTVLISGLHLTGKNPTGDGGAILKNAGALTIDSCLIDNSTTTGNGGAIRNRFADPSYSLTITNSTLAGNTANKGGAISWEAGFSLTIGNSTIANNHANDSSGAIDIGSFGGVFIYNSTVAGNSATFVGGINDQGQTLTLESTILANNTDITGINDVNRTAGTFNASYSLFSETFLVGDNVINGINTGNLQGANPLLGALGNNGGPTPTLLPAPTSPAIGAGANLQGYPFDQRGPGYPRNATGPDTTGLVDIGAVQGYVIPPPPASAVPTLQPWALLALALLVALVARRRRAA